MHSDTPTEAACWRIWYYLNERGACWDDSILASANIDEGLFDDAIDVLMELDVIMESEHIWRLFTYTFGAGVAVMVQLMTSPFLGYHLSAGVGAVLGFAIAELLPEP